MFNTNFLGLFGANFAGHVIKCLDWRCSIIVHLLDFKIGFSRQSQILRHNLNHDQNWMRCETLQLLIDENVTLNEIELD